jgi:hypothetical protein
LNGNRTRMDSIRARRYRPTWARERPFVRVD